LRSRSSSATRSAPARRSRSHRPSAALHRRKRKARSRREAPRARPRWTRAASPKGRAQNPAAAVIDVPAVEAGDAELDVAADAGKAGRPLDHIPHVVAAPVAHIGPGVAVTPVDGALVIYLRLVKRLADALEIGDGDIGQVRHMSHLMAEAA